jgi:hypothetical protein
MRIIVACVVAIFFNSAVLARENQEDKSNIPQTSASPTVQVFASRKTEPNLPRWFIVASPVEDWCTWDEVSCVQPKILTATEEMDFAMWWAEIPAASVLDGASPRELVSKAKQFDQTNFGTVRRQNASSTVGQGGY